LNPRITEMLTRLAIENPGVQGRFKMAAGIVYKKHLIATGINQYKTHPWMSEQRGYKPDQVYLHAEIDAIRNALKLVTQDQLTKCDIYVVRVKRPNEKSRNWIHGLAKPCPGCSAVIKTFGIKGIFFTENGKKEVDLCFN
jgi:tRNA(Arg) A34 adenosine deaminase TadA